MMKRRASKKVCGLLLSMAMVASMGIGVQAAGFSVPGTVKADGVRLRVMPDSTILELMYTGERVWIDEEGSNPNYYHLKRNQTGTIGWTDTHYVSSRLYSD